MEMIWCYVTPHALCKMVCQLRDSHIYGIQILDAFAHVSEMRQDLVLREKQIIDSEESTKKFKFFSLTRISFQVSNCRSQMSQYFLCIRPCCYGLRMKKINENFRTIFRCEKLCKSQTWNFLLFVKVFAHTSQSY